MREEDVTKAIMKWLLQYNWEIICFDFPQSGTGRFLHPNSEIETKNKNSINPDIVAVKNSICLFFENKDRYYLMDFQKQNDMINNSDYSQAINRLLNNYNVSKIYYGIGLPSAKYSDKVADSAKLVDFIVGVCEDKTISILYRSNQDIFRTE